MKIGIDARFWNESGVGRYIRNLVRELGIIDTKNEYVLFVNSRDKKTIQSQLSGGSFQIVGTDVKWHTLGEQLRFPSLLNSYNLDLVHFPYFSVPFFYNRPFVVTIHDLILHHFATGKATTLPLPVYWAKLQGYKFVLKQAAKRSKKIITVSSATAKEIVDHLGVSDSKIVVTYEGVDISLKNSQVKNVKDRYFLYVGNTYPHKNLEVLIRAFSEISDTKVKLILVGREDHFQKKTVNVSTVLYRNPNIIFKTHVDDLELSELYQHALALISPSLMEGFGLPLVEAMRLGCFVVASDIPSSREVCKDAAVYFNPRSVDSLRDILEKVLRNSLDTKTYVKRGKVRSESFSWKKMAEETLDVYTSSVNR